MSVFDSAWSVLKAPQMVRFSQGPRGKVKTQKEKKYFRDLVKQAILQGKDVASDKRMSPEAIRAIFGVDRVTEDMLDYKRDNRGRVVKDKDGNSIPNNPRALNAFNEIFKRYYTKDRKEEFRANPKKYGATGAFFEDPKDRRANRTGDFSRLDDTAAMNPQAERESTPTERAKKALAGFKPTTRSEINRKATEILRILNQKTSTDNFNQVRDLLYSMHPELKPKEKPPVDNTSTASRVASNLLANPILPKDGDKQPTLDDFGGDLQQNPIVPKKPDKKTSKTTPDIEEMIIQAEKLIRVANANQNAGKDVTATGHFERLDDVLERLKNQGVGVNEYNDTAKKLGIKRPQVADAVRPTPPPPPTEDTQSNGGLPLTPDGQIDIGALGSMYASQQAPAAKPPVKVQQNTQAPTETTDLESVESVLESLMPSASAPASAPAPELSERDRFVQDIQRNFGAGLNNQRAERMLDEHKANNPIDDHVRLLGDVGHMGRLSEHVGLPIESYSKLYQNLMDNPESYGLSDGASSADAHNHIMGLFDPNLRY